VGNFFISENAVRLEIGPLHRRERTKIGAPRATKRAVTMVPSHNDSLSNHE
jgi:hypothetical protein